MNIYSPKSLYIAESKIAGAGRGVFTGLYIAARTQVEVCPVMVIPRLDVDAEENRELMQHLYMFGDKRAVALGYGSLYNHSYVPNTRYNKIPQAGIIEFTAITDIYPMHEITVNYNHGDPGDTSPVGMGILPFR